MKPKFLTPGRVFLCWGIGLAVIVVLFLIGNDRLSEPLLFPIFRLGGFLGIGFHDIQILYLLFSAGSVMYSIVALLFTTPIILRCAGFNAQESREGERIVERRLNISSNARDQSTNCILRPEQSRHSFQREMM